MNYLELLRRLYKMHIDNWGAFNDFFPEPTVWLEDEAPVDLALAHTGNFPLLEHIRTFQGWIRDDKISFHEVSRMSQEYDTIRLLLLIWLWGKCINPDVPISEEDLQMVNSAQSDLHVAGWAEDEVSVLIILRRLIEKGTTTGVLPQGVSLLLTEDANKIAPPPDEPILTLVG